MSRYGCPKLSLMRGAEEAGKEVCRLRKSDHTKGRNSHQLSQVCVQRPNLLPGCNLYRSCRIHGSISGSSNAGNGRCRSKNTREVIPTSSQYHATANKVSLKPKNMYLMVFLCFSLRPGRTVRCIYRFPLPQTLLNSSNMWSKI